ncbi:UDP-N-acetylglucosamine 2-epimerase [Bradyrhizobium sp. HKCCYLS20291]|uniref:UDP-N-acetylglucosamine 2-epimerase n=1 Tax=Bradyrhizobium sp. HKCCYLS20291 TaxID=3420766 RepID=UPI003EC0BD68
MPAVTFVVGTVPDIIKSIEVARALAASGLRVTIYDTLQNRMDVFARDGRVPVVRTSVVRADCRDDLDWVAACASEIAELCGDLVVVQGDTYSALAGAHAARRAGATLAHIEAGLRSHDPLSPFPEEMNRVFIDTQSELLFCATPTDFDDLIATANVTSKKSFIVGNTVCDPIFRHRERLAAAAVRPEGILVSLHRRENYQHRQQILAALRRLTASHPGIHFRLLKRGLLADQEALTFGGNVSMIGMTEHLHFLDMLAASTLAICDSGGILEEAVTLGVPVVCLRRVLERGRLVDGVTCVDPEAIDGAQLAAVVDSLLAQPRDRRGALRETFGDGRSADRIAALLLDHLGEQASDDVDGAHRAQAPSPVLVRFERTKPAEISTVVKDFRTEERARRYAASASGADACEP